MDKKKLLLCMLLIVFAVALLLVLSQLTAHADETRTRGSGMYVGSDSCGQVGCHESQYDGWNSTYHPKAWDTLNNSSMKEESCEMCHVTGWGDEFHGGFNSSTDKPIYLRGIQCEACHGPGEDHVNSPSTSPLDVNLSAIVCGATCHEQKHHPYYQEWNKSGHAFSLKSLLEGAAEAAEDSCLECHSADYVLADVGDKPTLDTAKYAITCALCHDPHNAENPNQLRWPSEELCVRCHNPEGALPGDPIYHPQSSMRDGRSGAPILGEPFMPDVECADCHIYIYKPNITGHSFTQKPEACVVCHSTIPPIYSNDTAKVQISEWQSQTWTRTMEVHEIVVLSKGAIEDAPNYGFSENTIEIAVDLYYEANYSLAFVVVDGSGGAHNPAFASQLLNFSENRSRELISLLTPGTLKGRVVDRTGNPVEGVTIERDGRVWVTSKSNGTFEFLFAPGTHSFDLKLRGSHVGSIDSVLIVGGQVTDAGDVKVVELDFLVPIMIAIGVIILLSIIVAYLLFKMKKMGSQKKEV